MSEVLAANAQRVLTAVSDWLAEPASPASKIWLVTVVETYGSSPRPAGSLMALRIPPQDSGTHPEIVGSVSGGCLEQDLIERLSSGVVSVLPQWQVYGETSEEQSRYQLPCGGSLTVVLEPVYRDEAAVDHFALLVKSLSQRLQIAREVNLQTGLRSIINAGTAGRYLSANGADAVSMAGSTMTHRIYPRWRLLVLGASEVTLYLSTFAAAADFEVSICEPREDYAAGWRESAPLYRRLPDELIGEAFKDAFVAIVGVSHDPRVDDMGLMAALDTKAFFVGCMGSKKTSEGRRARLKDLGISDYQLAKLHAPVGIDIGSKTPAEIAISIVAQLVAERKRCLESLSTPVVNKMLSNEVLPTPFRKITCNA